MSTALTTQPREGEKLSLWVNQPEVKQQIAAAVGDVINGDQFTAHMMVALNRPDFARCSNASKAMAFLECAALGLLPTAGQVVLIPYKDQLKAMPQWQGYKALMERHPAVLEVQAYLVHVRDRFTVQNGQPNHSYDPLDHQRTFADLKDIRGGYCKIIYRDGRPPRYHFTTAAHISKARGCAQTQNVWKQWFEQMCLKTLYRDCYARRAVPIDPLVAARLERVTAADDVILGNDPRGIADGQQTTNERRISTLDALADRLESPQPADKAADDPIQEPTTETAPESPEDDPKPDFSQDSLLDQYTMMATDAATEADLNLLADQAAKQLQGPALASVQHMINARRQALTKTTGKGRQKSMLPEGVPATAAGH